MESSPFLQSRSRAIRRLLEDARRASASDATVSLRGESGTGKTWLAKQIHRWSRRRGQLFSVINCAHVAQQHPEGTSGLHRLQLGGGPSSRYLGDAEGGTLFLSGIDELPPALQHELSGFLQNRTLRTASGERTLDVRIIASSNRDFEEEVKARRLRMDLFYALNILSLRVPPLRERPEDICLLAAHLLSAAAIRHDRGRLQLSAEAAAALILYPWPGNVRELRNAMEAAAVLCQGESIALTDLPESVSNHARSILNPTRSIMSLDKLEREQIVRVVTESSTLEQAAARLGINITTLWRKRKHLKLNIASGKKSRSNRNPFSEPN
ncbi:MAG TPA: sigma 54-interacting transcriptional regulator [Candidatus Sulfotelmatobacter sp.]|nr:sigma 54-interacting transcriptional regulator [Candidatus Sulfotelmatobacter sp.]